MRYWGIHNGIREEEARPERRRNREYPHIPCDDRMEIGDVVCLFDTTYCLYGWGTITEFGDAYESSSGKRVRDVTVNQSYLQYQMKLLNELRQLEIFSDWERMFDENLSWFNDEQAHIFGDSSPRITGHQIPL